MKWSPFTSWATFSAMAPMSPQITGRPYRNASWITSGEPSHQREGTITQSTLLIWSARLARSQLLTKETFPASCSWAENCSRRSFVPCSHR